MKYREFKIKKKSRKFRKLVAPDEELLAYQRSKLKMLTSSYKQLIKGTDIEKVAHGFITQRNCVTAAEQHVGFKTTVMMDLSNFFDTVKVHMVPTDYQDPLFFHKEGYTAQGFATSPMLANLASINMLTSLRGYLQLNFKGFAFTVYGDDIQISLNIEDHKELNILIKEVKCIVESHDFIINPTKTRIKYAKYGFRRILGINVGDTHIQSTRKIQRKIRAAKHQGNKSSLGGLINWSKCKRPN